MPAPRKASKAIPRIINRVAQIVLTHEPDAEMMVERMSYSFSDWFLGLSRWK